MNEAMNYKLNTSSKFKLSAAIRNLSVCANSVKRELKVSENSCFEFETMLNEAFTEEE